MSVTISRRHALLFPWLGVAPFLKAQSAYELAVPGGSIEIAFVDDGFRDPRIIFEWINRAVKAIVGFYGEFPVSRLRLFVESVRAGRSVGRGITFGGSPPFINVSVGERAMAEDLADDWVLTHEFTHLAFPSVPERHRWMEEGLSTYVEPLARVQSGQLRVENYWDGLVKSLPQGQPTDGDRGLDGTKSWARTYWGGALFCFISDLRIRMTLGSGVGLQAALRSLVRQDATINEEWPLARVLEAADASIGASVLQDVYEEWADKPVRIDLDRIWQDLGVRKDGGRIRFDEAAPWAAIRREIVAAA